MPTLGGSLFVHNGIQYDYCFLEAVESLCGVCDEIVALDAQSTDGTEYALLLLQERFANLRVVTGAKWNCATDFSRLSILANEAASYLRSDWHLMLQADEVLHERSYPFIREAIASRHYDSFMVRRYNLLGDMQHCIRLDLSQDRKPCSDAIIRLARRGYPAYSDSESLQVSPCSFDCSGQLENITIFHYGLVRDDASLIEKVVDMQGWFFGPGGTPDHRIVAMREEKRFAWESLFSRDELMRIPLEHPIASRAWAAKRQATKKPLD